MSDNLRRYRAIREALTPGYPGEPSGRLAQHLTTLAAFISGIVGSKSSQLPSIATKVPGRAKPDSRVKRLARWLDNDTILAEVYFLPYAAMLLQQLAFETLVVVMDGSGVGRGCCALMMPVIYQGRALPLAWRVRQCPKGHVPEDLHIALVELVRELIPEGTKVVFLGDGEFDGTELQATLTEAGWLYACRTSKGNPATWEGETFALALMGTSIKPGRLIELKDVRVTHEAYGPVLLLCCWAKGYAEPLYVVSNMASAEDTMRYYQKRFRRSRTPTLRIIPIARKPDKMVLFHHHVRGSYHDTTPRLLSIGHHYPALAVHHAAPPLAEPTPWDTHEVS